MNHMPLPTILCDILTILSGKSLVQSAKHSFVIFIFLISSSHFIAHLQQQILTFTLVYDWQRHDWIHILLYRFFIFPSIMWCTEYKYCLAAIHLIECLSDYLSSGMDWMRIFSLSISLARLNSHLFLHHLSFFVWTLTIQLRAKVDTCEKNRFAYRLRCELIEDSYTGNAAISCLTSLDVLNADFSRTFATRRTRFHRIMDGR